MRKLLALLLISLLSLQASWAAAASYCRHEQGTSAKHFGHHEHQHARHLAWQAVQADAVGLDSDGANTVDSIAASLAGVDLDCSVCHAHALAGMPSAPALSVSDAPFFSDAALIQRLLSSVPQPRPERPNWFAA